MLVPSAPCGFTQQHSSGNNPVPQGTPPALTALGDGSESRIRATACDQLASADPSGEGCFATGSFVICNLTSP